jgi:hypothetical protein
MGRGLTMKIDFHFYLIYLLTDRCGFDRELEDGKTESHIIAYASQYVDDNNGNQVIGPTAHEVVPMTGAEATPAGEMLSEIRQYQSFPWEVRIKETGNLFRPVMTQTVSLKSLLPIFQRYLFVPFHFLPGDPARIPEIRGRRNPWSVTAGSNNASWLLRDALESEDLYRIGVALHTFADTWSHQNFCGFRDDWNAVSGSIFVPDVGHAEVFERPDTLSETWTDRRLGLEIDNRERSREALKAIFQWLSKYRNPARPWDVVEGELEEFLQAKDMEERIARVQALHPGLEYEEDPEKRWIYQALEYDTVLNEVVGREGFFDSSWYRFQCAAQTHLKTALPMFPEGV